MKKRKQKIKPAIGIISKDTFVLESTVFVAGACMWLMEHYRFSYGDLIWAKDRQESARNVVCEAAIEKGKTHILFIDADCGGDVLMLMPEIFKYTDYPIIGANAKGGLNKPVYTCDINRQPINYITDKPIESDSVGMHLALIDLSIFEKIPKPWFYAPPLADGSNQIITEDVAFCRKARKYGFRSYIHHTTSVRNIHFKRQALSMIDVVQKQLEEHQRLIDKQK